MRLACQLLARTTDIDRQNSTSRLETVKAEPSRAISIEKPPPRLQSATVKAETPSRAALPQKPGNQYPEVHTSTIDVNAVPTYGPSGKPITDVDIDAGTYFIIC